MKRSRTVANVLAVISFVGLLYCLATYLYLQSSLVPSVPEPAFRQQLLGASTVPLLVVAGIYHVVLLVEAFRSLARREGIMLVHSTYIVAIVLSGLNLLTDVTILSDIGKEYPHWDVTDQWWILYAFTALHLAVVIYGFLSTRKGVPEIEADGGRPGIWSDAFFLAMHQIGMVCGVLGVLAVVVLPGMVPDRYRTWWLLFLSVLAVFPLAVFVAYLWIRNRRRPLASWFDEKQTADMAAGALVSVAVVMPLLVAIAIAGELAHLQVPVSFWLMLVLFAHLIVMSGVALARSRTA